LTPTGYPNLEIVHLVIGDYWDLLPEQRMAKMSAGSWQSDFAANSGHAEGRRKMAELLHTTR
jgi:hypothetical protein